MVDIKDSLDISAKIVGIKYKPLLCRKLDEFELDQISIALKHKASFLLNIDEKNKIAVSWWRSAKRTRSYPYARVYNTLSFSGKKLTIIPIFKDEGIDGDRDFLQWDTIALMSLLGINVIVSYYIDASKSTRYNNKITNQQFDIGHITKEIERLLFYQSDALHWNSEQTVKIGGIAEKALLSYQVISNKTGIKMHSNELAKNRIYEILMDRESFVNSSRRLAKQAQSRESNTIQPKESLSGKKAAITIKNYLGGYYYLTVDEAEIEDNDINLIEAKHTLHGNLPSNDDIRDGLVKMILFTNLKEVKVKDKEYHPSAFLKLSVAKGFSVDRLNRSQKNLHKLLDEEAETNGFKLIYE